LSNRKKTIYKLFDSDQYSTLIWLTLRFGQDQGLKPMHYRWALIENHDNITQTPHIIEMEKFFSKQFRKWGDYSIKYSLDEFFEHEDHKKNCISSTSNLSMYLKKLVYDYKIFKRTKVENNNRYEIIDYDKYEDELLRADSIEMIKNCSDKFVAELNFHIIEFFIKKKKIKD